MKKIIEISFKKVNEKLFLYVYFDDGEIKKFLVKNKHKLSLFNLCVDIAILDKYK